MIECVPNFSEGRRREVIDSIAATIARIHGVGMLDIHADADHNRSVITFAGDADAVAEAAFQAVRAAAALIDMNEHRGEHPRVGATDVVPFVPLRGATLEQCVEIARAVGRRIGEELDIPVYLYEAAAARPDRVALPNLRRGEYEGLRDAIEHDPDRAPDFGPARMGTAGATIVGARPPLIAYNIYLNTGDVSVARRIAKAVRGSSGGLRGVRALGLLVNERAQVSMNLTDYRTTPLHRVVDMVAREAAAFGATIVESELVGLIPEDALIDAARFYLRLHGMQEDQLLERRLAAGVSPGAAEGAAPPTDGSGPGTEEAPPAAEERARTSWNLTVEALGTAACELAGPDTSASRQALMLRALGRELLALAGQGAGAASARAAARALLLVAERAVKVAELLPGMAEADAPRPVEEIAGTAYLAHAAATGARLRAMPLMPQLVDEELRANFEREFDSHARQAEELVVALSKQV